MDICKSKLNLWFLVEIRWIFAFDLVCIWWVEFVSCYRFGTWFEIDWLLSAINESEGRSVLQSGSVVGGLIGFQSLCFELISAFDLEIIDWWTKSQLKKKIKIELEVLFWRTQWLWTEDWFWSFDFESIALMSWVHNRHVVSGIELWWLEMSQLRIDGLKSWNQISQNWILKFDLVTK